MEPVGAQTALAAWGDAQAMMRKGSLRRDSKECRDKVSPRSKASAPHQRLFCHIGAAESRCALGGSETSSAGAMAAELTKAYKGDPLYVRLPALCGCAPCLPADHRSPLARRRPSACRSSRHRPMLATRCLRWARSTARRSSTPPQRDTMQEPAAPRSHRTSSPWR